MIIEKDFYQIFCTKVNQSTHTPFDISAEQFGVSPLTFMLIVIG